MIAYILKYVSIIAFAVMIVVGINLGITTFNGIECILASLLFLSLHLVANQMIKYDRHEKEFEAFTQEISELNEKLK